VSAGSASGSVFETRQFAIGNVVDYECRIVQTNRVYDSDAEDTFGDGFFILEVQVEQVVHVISPEPLTLAEVTDVVESGFNRGSGGRVRFRSLLQQHVAYNTIVTVEVLEGSLSLPKEESSLAPSIVPSSGPTPVPTSVPSMLPSKDPTMNPTTPTPSAIPSDDPSKFPSFRPSPVSSSIPTQALSTAVSSGTEVPSSLGPTFIVEQPSPAPSSKQISSQPSGTNEGSPLFPDPARPSTNSGSSDENRLPLVLGAIAGGVVTILVSCFFISCVWRPIRDNASSHDEEQEPKSTTEQGDTTISSSQLEGAIVSFSDDSSSLANTTLGDKTTGNFYTSARSQILQGGDPAANSFDENSLFTSPQQGESADGADDSFVGGSTSSYESSMIMPPSVEQVADFEDDFVIVGEDSSGDSEDIIMWRKHVDDSLSEVETGPIAPVKADQHLAILEFSEDDDSNPFVDDIEDDASDSDVDSLPKMMINESEDFGSVKKARANRPLDEHENLLNSSNETDSDEDSAKVDELTPLSSSHSKDIDSDNTGQSFYSSSTDRSASTQQLQSRNEATTSDKESNNELLRSVLEDAHLLSQLKSPSLSSKPSIKSAPPPLSRRGVNIGMIDVDPIPPKQSRNPSSSKSVGSPAQPRSFRDFGESAPLLPNRPPRNFPGKDLFIQKGERFADQHAVARTKFGRRFIDE